MARGPLLFWFLLSTFAASSMAQEACPGPVGVVAAFHRALASGDRQAALEQLDPEVTIFESGAAELSREEYASHHLEADMEFSAATERTIIARHADQEGDAAWVLTRAETSGTFRGKEIDVRGVETVLLRRRQGVWRIAHIHWSSRARAKRR